MRNMLHHRLDTVATTSTTEQQLDENSEVVQAAARLAGVSVHAILSHMRRLQRSQFDTTTYASGFEGVSLGRVDLPVMNRGTVRRDGWRAAMLGEDAVTPKLPHGQVAVSVSEEMVAAAMPERRQEDIVADVDTLREFMGAMSREDV